MTLTIPFNKASVEGREIELVLAAIDRGEIAGSAESAVAAVGILQEELAAEDVLLTTSCTAALELVALLLDIEPGDVVIVPSFTFVSTAVAFVRSGAKIRFADIDPVTLGINVDHVAELLDDRVRAVIPVHYAGIAADVDQLVELSRRNSFDIVEDNAHGLYGRLDNKPLGSFGRFSTLSFHETKNFTCGEGGALVVNRQSDVDRAHTLCDKGTNRRQFFTGTVDSYTWVDTGSSFRLSGLLAAFLQGQLEQRSPILAKRGAVTEAYRERLAPHAEELGFSCIPDLDNQLSPCHMFYVLLDSRQSRDRVLTELRQAGIMATFHYVPLHSSPGAMQFADGNADCPVTDEISGRLLRLPFFNSLTIENIEIVVDRFLRAAKH